MKTVKLFLPFLAAVFFNPLQAQNPDEVLATINDSIYKTADFERLYTKNIDIIADESQKDIAHYFELYKAYKVRLQDAYREELDKTEKFQHEYQTYRKQLAEKYFINEKELDRLLNEALERSDYEIKASHILFTVNEFAQPADTLKAYQKAVDVRNELLNKNLSFEEASLKYSDDLSAKNNQGNLGWFSVFRMVYPFENGAYQTNIGEISMPVRSSFGYHLVKVYDKRPVQDLKTIAHILVEATDKKDVQAKKKIDNIYHRLQMGERFEDASLHLSDDEHTREQGGLIGVYREGNIAINGISDVVYNLNEAGAYSQPFFSQHGWHIVKITDIKKKPLKDELYADFMRRIKSDGRSKILEKDLIEHLKERYHLQINEQLLKETADLLELEELFNNPEVEVNEQTEQELAVYGTQKITAKELLQHIYSFPREYARLKTKEEIIRKAFDAYSFQCLKQQYDRELETNFPEFAQTMQEYKEGLILFDWLEQKIWNPVTNDSIALQKYYEEQKENYLQPAYFIGEVYAFDKKYDAKAYRKFLDLKIPVKDEDFPMIYKYQGRFSLDDKRLPRNINLEKIEKKVLKHNNLYYVFLARDKKEPHYAEYDEVQNIVLSDYQKDLEERFTKKLLDNAEIIVNEEVLEQLKEKYHNEAENQ